jgi:hypothetical protein
MISCPSRRALRSVAFATLALGATLVTGVGVRGQAAPQASASPTNAAYEQIRSFKLTGASTAVSGFMLKRDRLEMTFTGTFLFPDPVDGQVTGAVFIGQGTFHAAVPAAPPFEKDTVKRLLNADAVDSDFKNAVLRMTDDSYALIKAAQAPQTASTAAGQLLAEGQQLATQFEPKLLHDTGLDLSARLALSLLNKETPGVFFAEFDGGARGRFDAVVDYQTRIPTMAFGIDGGEKGLIFASVMYQAGYYVPELWMAFYGESDYGKVIPYSDANNLVDITHYGLDVNLLSAPTMAVTAKIEATASAGSLRAINFNLGRGLPTFRDMRLKNALRVKSVKAGGEPAAFAQVDWESGFTVFLPAAANAGDKLALEVTYAGEYLDAVPDGFYLFINDSWIPTHGPLDRATFDMAYHHAKRFTVVSAGVRTSDGPDPARPESTLATFKMEQPVALVAFSLGVYKRSQQKSSPAPGHDAIPLEFYTIPQRTAVTFDDFFLAEMGNAIGYFENYFGKYPFPQLSGVVHPYGFGQGFASILFLYYGAGGSAADNNVSAEGFISHETAHQWWGHVILWRSYRDQWLSEGFAEYSSFLYAGERDNLSQKGRTKSQQSPGHHLLVERAREQLRNPPKLIGGVTKGRLADIGPIVLGHRLNTSKTLGAYQALIYAKGALVLRMLNYLLSNPSQDPSSVAYFATMTDFVNKYRGGAATTEQFFAVASEAFAKSPIAAKYGMSDLNWFRDQWVYGTGLPSYNLEYELQVQPDNTCVVSGTLHQDGVSDTWIMPIPVAFTLANGSVARVGALANGPATKVQWKLPSKPTKVELDPASWILSEKTTATPKGK